MYVHMGEHTCVEVRLTLGVFPIADQQALGILPPQHWDYSMLYHTWLFFFLSGCQEFKLRSLCVCAASALVTEPYLRLYFCTPVAGSF